jgi:hypothetical protein
MNEREDIRAEMIRAQDVVVRELEFYGVRVRTTSTQQQGMIKALCRELRRMTSRGEWEFSFHVEHVPARERGKAR